MLHICPINICKTNRQLPYQAKVILWFLHTYVLIIYFIFEERWSNLIEHPTGAPPWCFALWHLRLFLSAPGKYSQLTLFNLELKHASILLRMPITCAHTCYNYVHNMLIMTYYTYMLLYTCSHLIALQLNTCIYTIFLILNGPLNSFHILLT
jgi:hypothetical protein